MLNSFGVPGSNPGKWLIFGLGVNLPGTFKDAEDGRFAIGPSTAFSLNPSRPKVAFIDLHDAEHWTLGFASSIDALA